jgi:hypothetical protein
MSGPSTGGDRVIMATIASDQLERFLASPLLAGVDEAARLAIFHSLVEASVPAGVAFLIQGKPKATRWPARGPGQHFRPDDVRDHHLLPLVGTERHDPGDIESHGLDARPPIVQSAPPGTSAGGRGPGAGGRPGPLRTVRPARCSPRRDDGRARRRPAEGERVGEFSDAAVRGDLDLIDASSRPGPE